MNTDMLNQENVGMLDEILNICIRDGIVTKNNLPIFGDAFIGDIPDFKLHYFRDYFDILDKSGTVKVQTMKDNVSIEPIQGFTRNFIIKGGFTKLYNDQLKEIEHQELLKEKDKIDVEISKFNRDKQKTYYTFTVISFILSLLAIGISIYSMFKS